MWDHILRRLATRAGSEFIRCAPEQRDALQERARAIGDTNVPPRDAQFLGIFWKDGITVAYTAQATPLP